MSLELEPDTDGLWIDPDLHGQSATHAVVIGVSKYHHLPGGDRQPATKDYGLGQLHVSALTAYRVFDWLRSSYCFSSAPIGSIHLLLSPTLDEEQTAPEMRGSYAPADFDSCEVALHDWRERLRTIPEQLALNSRAFFFFSGHGLEFTQQMQMALPADYLDPHRSGINRAISTLNLKNGLRTIPIREQLFFVDACRTGLDTSLVRTAEGAQIFNIEPPGRNDSRVDSALLYGTMSGAASWQPSDPVNGISLFGNAFLSAVDGGARVDESEDPPVVWLYDVASYVDQQLKEMLNERGTLVRQSVKGDLAFVRLIESARRRVPAADNAPVPAPPEPNGRSGADTLPAGGQPKEAAGTDRARFAHEEGWSHVDANAGPRAWLGRKSTARIWTQGARAYDLGTGERVEILIAEAFTRGPTMQRLRLSFDTDRLVWFRIDAPNARFASVVPASPTVLYEVTMTWDGKDLIQLDLDIADERPLDTASVAQRWREYLPGSALGANAANFDDWTRQVKWSAEEKFSGAPPLLGTSARRRRENELRWKLSDEDWPYQARRVIPQFQAIIAALVLLRAGVREPFPTMWARNMATLLSFPYRADGAAVWATMIGRYPENAGLHAAPVLGDAVGLLADTKTLPLTADAFELGFAAAHLAVHSDLTGRRQREVEPYIAKANRRFRRVAPYFHPGGLMLVLQGPRELITPDLNVGKKVKKKKKRPPVKHR